MVNILSLNEKRTRKRCLKEATCERVKEKIRQKEIIREDEIVMVNEVNAKLSFCS